MASAPPLHAPIPTLACIFLTSPQAIQTPRRVNNNRIIQRNWSYVCMDRSRTRSRRMKAVHISLPTGLLPQKLQTLGRIGSLACSQSPTLTWSRTAATMQGYGYVAPGCTKSHTLRTTSVSFLSLEHALHVRLSHIVQHRVSLSVTSYVGLLARLRATRATTVQDSAGTFATKDEGVRSAMKYMCA